MCTGTVAGLGYELEVLLLSCFKTNAGASLFHRLYPKLVAWICRLVLCVPFDRCSADMQLHDWIYKAVSPVQEKQ